MVLPMADPADLKALAQRYLDFWQEQASALAADPATADMVAKLFGSSGLGAFAAGSAATSSGQHDDTDRKSETREDEPESGGATPPGTAAAGPASVADRDRVDELLRRIARLEERVADLERALAGSRS